MKIEINPGDRQLAFLAVFATVVLVIGLGVAYTDPPAGGNPATMGHSVDEMDWSNPLPGNLLVGGDVGIGTPTPGQQLTITGCLRFDDAGTGDVDVDFCNDDASYNDDGIALRILTNPASGEPIFRVLSSGGSERLRVEHDGALKTTNVLEVDGTGNSYIQGNVGIGITNPGTSKLKVVGGPIEATGGLIIETRTTNPGSPSTGQMWLCTDPAPYCQ